MGFGCLRMIGFTGKAVLDVGHPLRRHTPSQVGLYPQRSWREAVVEQRPCVFRPALTPCRAKGSPKRRLCSLRSLPDHFSQAGSSLVSGSTPSVEVLPQDASETAQSLTERDPFYAGQYMTPWLDYFAEVEKLESDQMRLEEELQEHVTNERYREAAIVREELDQLISKDVISTIHTELKAALKEERYEDAAELRDEGLVGLSGWWVARGPDDPRGRIIHISPDYCRYLGRGFTPREIGQLCGVPDSSGLDGRMHGKEDTLGMFVLEVFLKRDPNGTLQHQGCVLTPPVWEVEEEDAQTNEDAPEVNVQAEKTDAEDALKVTIVLLEKDSSQDSADAEVSAILQPSDEDVEYDDEMMDSSEEFSPLEMTIRRFADLRWWDRNRFVLSVHPPLLTDDAEGDLTDQDPHLDVEQIADHVSDEFASRFKKLLDSDIFPKLQKMKIGDEQLSQAICSRIENRLKELQQQLENGDTQAISNLQKRLSDKIGDLFEDAQQSKTGLDGEVMFTRLPKDEGSSTDPFSGIFIGSYGVHGPELMHLSRQMEKSSGKEYVYVRKITGDSSVPAGEVSFRAALGRENRTVPDVRHAEELGIRAQYSGKGRIANTGYKNARWVDGELLVLDPSSPIAAGAEVGLVWNVPQHRKLHILLYRVALPEMT